MKCGRQYRGLILRNVRDLEVVDSELRLLLATRRMVGEAEGRTPSTARMDELRMSARDFCLNNCHPPGTPRKANHLRANDLRYG